MGSLKETKFVEQGAAQPAFVDFKRDGKVVRVTVRQASINNLTPGPTAFIDVPLGYFEALILEAMELPNGD